MMDAHIVFVLDRTGSMGSMWDEALSGLNNFIKEQAALEGDAYFTLVAFDSQMIETVYEAWNCRDIPEITDDQIWPRSMTPLHDAIVKSASIGREWLKNNDWFEGKKIFAVLTDGYENASKEATKKTASETIRSLQSDGWDCLYLATNQDAWAEGSQLGYQQGQTMSYSPTGQSMAGTYSTLSSSVSHSRETGGRTVIPEEEGQ